MTNSKDPNVPTEAVYEFSLSALRDSDRDRYLACLLSPADKRGPLSALYAFHAEIARIRDLVREPLPGEIRLQWWRDVLDDPRAGALDNNLAIAVARALTLDRAAARAHAERFTWAASAAQFFAGLEPMQASVHRLAAAG